MKHERSHIQERTAKQVGSAPKVTTWVELAPSIHPHTWLSLARSDSKTPSLPSEAAVSHRVELSPGAFLSLMPYSRVSRVDLF